MRPPQCTHLLLRLLPLAAHTVRLCASFWLRCVTFAGVLVEKQHVEQVGVVSRSSLLQTMECGWMLDADSEMGAPASASRTT